jgi:hypothetical protein
MPRKRVADVARAEPAIRQLDAALGRQPVARYWSVTVRLFRHFWSLPPESPAFTEAIEAFMAWADRTAELVCRDPSLQGYFRGRDRVEHVRGWLDMFAATACGVPPEEVAIRPHYVWAPRGRRLGSKLTMTVEDFVSLEAAARRDFANDPDLKREPTDADIRHALGLKRASYYRLKSEAIARGELVRPQHGPERV